MTEKSQNDLMIATQLDVLLGTVGPDLDESAKMMHAKDGKDLIDKVLGTTGEMDYAMDVLDNESLKDIASRLATQVRTPGYKILSDPIFTSKHFLSYRFDCRLHQVCPLTEDAEVVMREFASIFNQHFKSYADAYNFFQKELAPNTKEYAHFDDDKPVVWRIRV